jgi:tRNA threonylcarbamoyladenosine biosynthesis protein TsaB
MLAIDTSTEVAGLALAPVGEEFGLEGAELRWNAGRNHTTTLLAEIDHLCRLCAIGIEQLSAIAVATGPGSFTALRVGMSVAKGLAFALGIPILGIGTLDAAAHGAAHWKLPVRAFVPAGRGRFVTADFVWSRGRLTQRGEIRHRAPEELGEGLLQPTVLVGELPEREAPALRALKNVVLPEPSVRRRRASALIDLAVPRWRAGEWDDLVSLEPLYVHTRPPASSAAAG